MSYIGKTPTVGNFVKLDALTASATASYTMQVDSVNFSPESVNHMLVSLNGVIQSPTTSYTISGATITFASALTSSDSIDFIMVYGNVLDIGTPSDATVTNAKTNFVSTSSAAGLQIKGDGTTDGTLQLNCSQNSHGVKIKSPAHSASASYTLTLPTTDGDADQVLKTNGSGVLDWTTVSSGGLVYVGGASIVATNTAQVNVDNVFSSTYRNYKVIYEATSNTNTADIRMKLRDSSGDISQTDRYNTTLGGHNSSGQTQNGTDVQTTYFRLSQNTPDQGNTDYPASVGEIIFYAPNVSTDLTHGTLVGGYRHSGGEHRSRYGALMLKTQHAVTGLALTSSSGSINDAQIKVYGIVDS